MHNFKQVKSQKGVTIIELLIALVLGVTVIMGVVRGVSALSNSSRVQINNNELQETGNTALDYVSFQLRSAFASPCSNVLNAKGKSKYLTIDLPDITNTPKTLYDETTITDKDKLKALIEGRGISIKPTDNGNGLLTDNITFWGTKARLIDPTKDTDIKKPFDAKRPFAVSDCEKIEIVNGAAAKASSMAIKSPLVANVISVKDGELSVRDLYGSKETLMQGVEAIRIFFSVDNVKYDKYANIYIMDKHDGVVDELKTASQLNDVDEVISAELFVLVRGDWNINTQSNKKLYFPKTDGTISDITKDTDSVISFNDKIPRKVFTRSINLRNHAKVFGEYGDD